MPHTSKTNNYATNNLIRVLQQFQCNHIEQLTSKQYNHLYFHD